MTVVNTRRPVELRILIVLIVWSMFWNGVRFFQALLYWRTLVNYPPEIGPLYIATSGAVWVMLGLFLIWACWQGKPWAWGSLLGGTLGYAGWVLMDRFFLQSTHGNEIFVWLTYFVILFMVIMLLSSKHLRDYYHDR
jgi:hypothetical protein